MCSLGSAVVQSGSVIKFCSEACTPAGCRLGSLATLSIESRPARYNGWASQLVAAQLQFTCLTRMITLNSFAIHIDMHAQYITDCKSTRKLQGKARQDKTKRGIHKPFIILEKHAKHDQGSTLDLHTPRPGASNMPWTKLRQRNCLPSFTRSCSRSSLRQPNGDRSSPQI